MCDRLVMSKVPNSEQGVVMAMRIHILRIKAIVAFMLVLCLAMPFFFSVAADSIMAAHTHICYDEDKDVCADVRKCCTICVNFYEAKYRFQNRYCNVADKFLYAYTLSAGYFIPDFAFTFASLTTLVSLKVRLNN